MAMAAYMRLMMIRRGSAGYEVLLREVSESLHLRRFYPFSLTGRVSDESTMRKAHPVRLRFLRPRRSSTQKLPDSTSPMSRPITSRNPVSCTA